MKNSESHIVLGIRLGRESTYRDLFAEYYRPLSVFAMKYVGDLETAKEIVQDFFVHLFQNRESIVISTSLKSYLFRAVRNRSLNYIRKNKSNRHHLEQYSAGQESTEDLEAKILETELEHRIFKIVNDLPPQCRKIFTLSRVNGLSNKEIAGQLQISIRTVETQISNALKTLRSKLNPLP